MEKRTKNRKLLNSYQGKPCVVCFHTIDTTAHHIKSVGAGGPDKEFNLIPLCFAHHRLAHDKGLNFLAQSFSKVRQYLRNNGWQFDNFLSKWTHSELNK